VRDMSSMQRNLVRVTHRIYLSKATTYLKLHKKGVLSNFAGVPGFFARLKECVDFSFSACLMGCISSCSKKDTVKEGWSFLTSTLDVQSAMTDMQKMQDGKAEALPEDQMKDLESDLMGKMLLVGWKGTRFEVAGILRQAVDLALAKEPGVSEAQLTNRAKAILIIGSIMKAIEPDADDLGERRCARAGCGVPV
jgi:hypothetical protein